jgi:hypothetical protein
MQVVTFSLGFDEDNTLDIDDIEDVADPEEIIWTPITPTPRPSKEVENRILQFSSEFGLLGILHRRYSRIAEPSRPDAGQQSYWQRGLRVDELDTLWGRGLVLGGAKRYGLCISADGDGDVSLSAINNTYLGGLPLKAIPRPDSEEFFRMYGEPVEFWIEEAVWLATAIRENNGWEISALLRTTWTDYVFGESIAWAQLRAGSLLEALALQYIQDYNAGFELRYCENKTCERRLYYDNDPRSRFCSQRCASTHRQRDYRETQRRLKAARIRRRK